MLVGSQAYLARPFGSRNIEVKTSGVVRSNNLRRDSVIVVL